MVSRVALWVAALVAGCSSRDGSSARKLDVPTRVPDASADAVRGVSAESGGTVWWRFVAPVRLKSPALDLQISRCSKDRLPRKGLSTSQLETIEASPGWVTLNPVVTLKKGEWFCSRQTRVEGLSEKSRVTVEQTNEPNGIPIGRSYLESPGSRGLHVNATVVAPVELAGLTFQSKAVIDIADDGVVSATEEGVVAVDAKTKKRWISKRNEAGLVVFFQEK
jgi:hypothetical protein